MRSGLPNAAANLAGGSAAFPVYCLQVNTSKNSGLEQQVFVFLVTFKRRELSRVFATVRHFCGFVGYIFSIK